MTGHVKRQWFERIVPGPDPTIWIRASAVVARGRGRITRAELDAWIAACQPEIRAVSMPGRPAPVTYLRQDDRKRALAWIREHVRATDPQRTVWLPRSAFQKGVITYAELDAWIAACQPEIRAVSTPGRPAPVTYLRQDDRKRALAWIRERRGEVVPASPAVYAVDPGRRVPATRRIGVAELAQACGLGVPGVIRWFRARGLRIYGAGQARQVSTPDATDYLVGRGWMSVSDLATEAHICQAAMSAWLRAHPELRHRSLHVGRVRMVPPDVIAVRLSARPSARPRGWWSTQRVMDDLGVTRTTVCRWVAGGALEAVRVSGNLLINPASVRALAASRVGAPAGWVTVAACGKNAATWLAHRGIETRSYPTRLQDGRTVNAQHVREVDAQAWHTRCRR